PPLGPETAAPRAANAAISPVATVVLPPLEAGAATTTRGMLRTRVLRPRRGPRRERARAEPATKARSSAGGRLPVRLRAAAPFGALRDRGRTPSGRAERSVLRCPSSSSRRWPGGLRGPGAIAEPGPDGGGRPPRREGTAGLRGGGAPRALRCGAVPLRCHGRRSLSESTVGWARRGRGT